MAAITRLSKQTITALSSGTSISTRSFASGNRQIRLRKDHKGRMKGFACRGNNISFGDFGLQALECSWVTAKQIEAGRRAVQRSAGKTGKVWVRLIADKSVSEKPIGTRMGSGKGAPQYTVAVVKPGRMLYEVGGVPENVAKKAIALAAAKMPIKTVFRSRGFCSVASELDRQKEHVEESDHGQRQMSELNLPGDSPILLPKLLQALNLNK